MAFFLAEITESAEINAPACGEIYKSYKLFPLRGCFFQRELSSIDR